jgi:hypothetical protein
MKLEQEKGRVVGSLPDTSVKEVYLPGHGQHAASGHVVRFDSLDTFNDIPRVSAEHGRYRLLGGSETR